MKLDLYQVDAFADAVFRGNPAAVCPLENWIPDKLMQDIAMENNLSETAFFVEENGRFRLRWFTPETEVDLCGHATLASAHVLLHHLGYDSDTIYFECHSGELTVKKAGDRLKMNFPANPAKPAELPAPLMQAFAVDPLECYRSFDYLLVLEQERQVDELDPDFSALKKVDTRGIIVTAPGKECDFVSRFFAPSAGIDEDPVTGSAHTILAPYWAQRLNKKKLEARQLSKRGGTIWCSVESDRVEIAGYAQTYMKGTIEIPG